MDNSTKHTTLQSAMQCLQYGQFDKAFALLQELYQADTNDVDTGFLLGVVLGRLGRAEEAVGHLRHVVASKPEHALAYFNLGLALRTLGNYEAAVEAFRRVTELAPDRPEAFAHGAVLLMKLGRQDEAAEQFSGLLAINPHDSEAMASLARIRHAGGRLVEAERLFREALRISPGNLGVVDGIARVLSDQGRHRQALELHREAIRIAGNDNPYVHSNMLLTMQYMTDIEPSALFQAHLDWARAHTAPVAPAPGIVAGQVKRGKLRIGYVSADFRRHSVAFFIEPLLSAHDSGAVDVHCYASVAFPDEVTERLRGMSTYWCDAHNMSDQQLADRIRHDRIDVLVDLSGHSGVHRLGMFAMRPAPVQVTWLGYPGTTGLASMDYRITDEWSDPIGSEAYHTETLIRLDDGFLCYQAPACAPAVSSPPATENECVTFGSFNNLAKVNTQVVDVWADILKTVPDSRLVMKCLPFADEGMREIFFRMFDDRGIGRERLALLPHEQSLADHLSSYAKIDIALDTFPYNGTTTTCEALWMGVPVVTLVGDRHAGRVGKSLVNIIGHPEWAVQSREEYIGLAATMAGDIAGLSSLREGLRGRVSASALCDKQAFSRKMEAAYCSMCSANADGD